MHEIKLKLISEPGSRRISQVSYEFTFTLNECLKRTNERCNSVSISRRFILQV